MVQNIPWPIITGSEDHSHILKGFSKTKRLNYYLLSKQGFVRLHSIFQ